MINVDVECGQIFCNRKNCARLIGLVDFDNVTAILIAVRKCTILPYSTVTEHQMDQSPTKLMVGTLCEMRDDDFDFINPNISIEAGSVLSLMRVSGYDFDVHDRFSPLTVDDNVERSDLSLICEETLSSEETKSVLFDDGVTTASTPKRNHLDDIIENVVAGLDETGSSSRSVITISKMPKRKLFDLNNYEDLATVLPGEKLPDFS